MCRYFIKEVSKIFNLKRHLKQFIIFSSILFAILTLTRSAQASDTKFTLEIFSNPTQVTEAFFLEIPNQATSQEIESITLTENMSFNKNRELPQGISYDLNKNIFVLDWQSIQPDGNISLPIIVEGNDNLTVTLKEDPLDPTNYQFVLVNNASSNTTAESQSALASSSAASTSTSQENSEIESQTDKQATDHTQEENHEIEEASEATSNEESSPSVTSQLEDSQESAQIEASHSSSDQAKARTAVPAQTRAGTSVSVSTWDDFEAALAKSDVSTINLTASIETNTNLLTTVYSVVGDKVINANGLNINMRKNRINLQNYQLTVNNLTITANQVSSQTNASVFFSESNTNLILNNVSFNGPQSAQLARMTNGTVTVKGINNRFVNSGGFEIFEARHIIFAESSEFYALNESVSLLSTNLKRLINLYNNGVIDVKENANVTLEIADRPSVIASEDGTKSTINVAENASLNIVALNADTNGGNPLIYLPGADSNIYLANNARLDIDNQRLWSNKPGALISMNGRIHLAEQGNKVAVNMPSSGTTTFPRILNGELVLNGTSVNSASADPTSSLSKGSQANKDFVSFFNGLDMSLVKQLSLAPADKPAQAQVDDLTDVDTAMTGKASPGLTVSVSDQYGNKFETTADTTTGEFSIDLGLFAPYSYGEVFEVTTSDQYGQSDPLSVVVQGNRLSFRVPSHIEFRPTTIENNLITIPRVETDWAIEVTHTRQISNPWKLTVQAVQPLTSQDGTHSIDNALIFLKDGNSQSLSNQVLIHEGVSNESTTSEIHWSKDEGLLLQLNPEASNVKPYQQYNATIEWTLTDAP